MTDCPNSSTDTNTDDNTTNEDAPKTTPEGTPQRIEPSTTYEQSTDPPRKTTPGRGPGHGKWLEDRVATTLEEWGYRTTKRTQLITLTADVTARREDPQDDPSDFLVVECKDWATKLVGEQTIIRLCLLAFVARAMPVLCHTTHLTDRAWELAQAYDVRLLTLDDLGKDHLPPLTTRRPPAGTTPHRQGEFPRAVRSRLPLLLCRTPACEYDIEGPVFGHPNAPPCYVPDRTGHDEYVSAYESDYEFHDKLP
jgi:hypothetical protein